MSDLAVHVARCIEGWPDESIARLCGSDDPDALAARFDAWCAEHLGAAIARTRCFAVSVGPVAGVELADGRAIVVKAHRARASAVFLRDARAVQAHLAARGFPCPVPLAGPHLFGELLAVADTWLDDPGPYLGPGAMAASAEGLARVVRLAHSIDTGAALDDYFMRRRAGERYPEPHSPLFDFTIADPRIPFVDELADRALAVLGRLDDLGVPRVVAHGDWSARNVRMGPERVRAVYDWDSLVRAPEAVVVGVAAATWRSHGEADDPIAPDAGEAAEYLGCYEEARGAPFSDLERRAVLAQALHCLCYTARCEISLGPGHPRRAIGRLERGGEDFLRRP